MCELINEKSYSRYVVLMTVLYFIMSILIYVKVKNYLIFFIFILFLLITISEKFLKKISIQNKQIEITYYAFLLKRKLIVNNENITSTIKKVVNFRGGTYYVLSIIKNEKELIFKINSQQGNWEEEDLKKIMFCLEQGL